MYKQKQIPGAEISYELKALEDLGLPPDLIEFIRLKRAEEESWRDDY